jgi:phospholipase/lecithinase/hemolysin
MNEFIEDKSQNITTDTKNYKFAWGTKNDFAGGCNW